MPRIPTCVLSSSSPAHISDGHHPDRFVEIGSLTKVVTSTVLQRMEATGVLRGDDPLERWLNVPAGSGITLRHLAQHTSGLPRLPPKTSRRDPYAAFDDRALQEILERLDALVQGPPGQHEEYSNLGYAILGRALTVAGEATYEELVHSYVLNPLGISDIAVLPPRERRLLAPGRLRKERRPWTMAGAILPAGGLWATPDAAAALVVRLLVDRALGDPGLAWQTAGPLLWHNGATRDASVFAGAMSDGRWVLVHRLNGSPDATDQLGLRSLKNQRTPPS
ncbi:serine hydrolase domain-containing protein [Streptomyces sp. NPDC060027]|uniref:serine hydrolase domain-containing protein n=1 Tax=Streptomyces sp. NPDC060027 TaxID=3347040 RepID=UPI0036A8E325